MIFLRDSSQAAVLATQAFLEQIMPETSMDIKFVVINSDYGLDWLGNNGDHDYDQVVANSYAFWRGFIAGVDLR